MPGRRFTNDEIDSALDAWEAGASIWDVCLRHGVSEATLYRWRSRRLPNQDGVGAPVRKGGDLRRMRAELAVATAVRDALRLVVSEILPSDERERAARLIEARCRWSTRRARQTVGPSAAASN